ncbi:MAG: 50S ribosomal protein L21 [Candidatus Fermentibacteraceae bacterium]|nr:50S ribosomal protein L21 [Candidatus Fermentibacteraceae bacterium]MBN2608716.1 50S ribosomal protein L21 [Candidatus Fermentibacteraceae bacterium]
MYAIIETGGFQFRVEPGMKLNIPRLTSEEGESITLGKVMLLADGEEVAVGSPLVEGASVEAQVLEHGRGGKITVFKRKRRKGYEKTRGHRQDYTRIEIKSINRG